jgi:tRNA1Val (adenine37-N6)-methyltransferase
MKVCTDSCLFGAWVAERFKDEGIQNVLDIGSGTGLLSIMLAQKISAEFAAVELNADAYNQTKNNFNSSPWQEKLHACLGDIRQFKTDNKYDLIICNPPFYQKSLRSPHNAINEARHNVSLQPIDLLNCVQSLLKLPGNFAVLLPYDLTEKFIELANQHRLFVNHLIMVNDTTESAYIRSMIIFSTTAKIFVTNKITIKNGNDYTEVFKSLLKDYYLAL